MEIYPFQDKIRAHACYFGLPASLVAAICSVESNFSPWACRFEPGFHRRYSLPWAKKHHPNANPLELALLSTSLGMMQVMGLVAVELGLRPNRLSELFDASRGIWFGCRKLRQLMKRYRGNIEDVISAYNQGNNRFFDLDRDGLKDPGEPYRNQKYVDKVLRQMRRFERLEGKV